MAEDIPSQISFSRLLSHTFPGIFPTIGIFLIIFLIFSNPSSGGIRKIFFDSWQTFIAALGGLIFFGTIIGVVIDSIHHEIEDHILGSKSLEIIELHKKEDEFFKVDDKKVSIFYYMGFLPLERFRFLHDEYYSYIESSFNLSISFFISAFLYSTSFFLFGYNLLIVCSIFIILFSLSVFCYYNGKSEFIEFMRMRIDFIDGALKHLDMFNNSKGE